jgi:CRISPR/Cas system-associated exonuclease Cas4 (RecB family)
MGVPSWIPRFEPPLKRPSSEEVKKRLQERYGISSVRASDISSQLYCEKKVELTLLHPEVRKATPELLAGQQGHEELAAGAIPISPEDLRQKLESGEKLLVRESLLFGNYQGIPIAGKPDLVDYDGLKARLLVEYKFSSKREPYPDHLLQLTLYGLLLHLSKRDTTGLVGVLAFLPPEMKQRVRGASGIGQDREDEMIELCRKLRTSVLRKKKPASASNDQFACFAYPFDLARARRLLKEPAEFWLGNRQAVPTAHRKKCQVCEFNAAGLCASALAKPSPEFLSRVNLTYQ